MGQRSSNIRRRRRVRRALGLALSLGLHAGGLAVLAVRLVPRVAGTRPESRAIQLDLTPEPPKTSSLSKAQNRAEAATPSFASALSAGSATLTDHAPGSEMRSTLPAPAPLGSAMAPSGAAKGSSPWTVEGAGVHSAPFPGYGVGAGLQGLVRATVGCTHADYLRLDAEEKARCGKGYGEAARGSLKVDALPAEKRAAYDLAAEVDTRRRGMREGALNQPTVLCSGPQSNLGASCLPPEAIHGTMHHPSPQVGDPSD